MRTPAPSDGLGDALLGAARPSAAAREAHKEATRATEALRADCEFGLKFVRALMGYMLCVSVAVAAASGVCEWIVVESNRGSLESDWWKCLCDDTALAHWVDSDQSEKIPTVLATTMLQSTIMGWVALVVTQRACIRMDWISSAIVNVLFLTLVVTLPPLSTAWPAPTAISSSFVNLVFWVRPAVFRSVPEPNDCGRAYRFCCVCVGLTAAVLVSNLAALCFLARAETRRRALVRAEDIFFALEKESQEEDEESEPDEPAPTEREDAKEAGTPPSDAEEAPIRGTVARRRRLRRRLEHRLYCCSSAPRSISIGVVMGIGYVVCAVSRACVSVLAQRCFDDAVFAPRGAGMNGNPVVRGAVAYVAAAPGLAIGAGAAFTSFASLLRGFAAEDLANFRIAFLLGFAALYVDLPAFVATVQGTRRHDLFFSKMDACVDNYMLRDAADVYGYPSRPRARQLCYAVKCDLWGTVVHVAMVFCMTVSAARTFSYNDRSLAAAVEPEPGAPAPRRAMHLLHAADACTFEYDMRADPRSPARARPMVPDSARYSAMIIRPRHSQLTARPSRSRQTWGPTANPMRQPFDTA